MSLFFSDKDYKKYGMDSIEFHMAKSAERAIRYRDDVVSLDSKYVIEVAEGLGRLEVVQHETGRVDSRILLPIDDFGPDVELAVPQVFDFITGIEAMTVGGPLPDWTGCGKQYPIREAYKGNSLRAKYTQSVADRMKIDILINPGMTELYTFPQASLYYTRDQTWHREEAQKNRDLGRIVLDVFPEGKLSYISIDTWNGRWFPNSLMLVPHPETFGRNYQESQVDWDGQSLRYRWNARMFHDISISPSSSVYYTTAATDRMLRCDAQAYWMFVNGMELGKHYLGGETYSRTSASFKISYQLSVSTVRVRDGIALAASSVPGEFTVDLDQSECDGQRSTDVLAIYPDEYSIADPQAEIQEGDIVSRYRLPVYINNGKNEYLDLPGEMIVVPTIKKGARLVPIIPPGYPVVIFGSYRVLEANFFSFYLKYRPPVHRSVPYLRTSALSIAEALNAECSFVDYAAAMEKKYGRYSSRIWVVLLRQNGAMLHRYDHDRYIMHAKLPGIDNAQEIWNMINTNRQTKIVFRRKTSQAYIRSWLLIMKRNKLLSYYDDFFEQLVIIDPYNDNGVVNSVHVDNADIYEEVRLPGEGVRDIWLVYDNVEYVTLAPVTFTIRQVLLRLAQYLKTGRPRKLTLIPVYRNKVLGYDDIVPSYLSILKRKDASPRLWQQYLQIY